MRGCGGVKPLWGQACGECGVRECGGEADRVIRVDGVGCADDVLGQILYAQGVELIADLRPLAPGHVAACRPAPVRAVGRDTQRPRDFAIATAGLEPGRLLLIGLLRRRRLRFGLRRRAGSPLLRERQLGTEEQEQGGGAHLV